MDLTFSKRLLISAFLLAVVIAVTLILAQISARPVSPPLVEISTMDETASQAGASALDAFFTLDYLEGRDAWLARFCSLSTPGGCEMIRQGMEPLWQRVDAEKIQITARISAETKLAETAHEQVWKMTVDLSAPLPGSNRLQDEAFVALVRSGDGWLFDRFLLEPEIESLTQRLTPEKN